MRLKRSLGRVQADDGALSHGPPPRTGASTPAVLARRCRGDVSAPALSRRLWRGHVPLFASGRSAPVGAWAPRVGHGAAVVPQGRVASSRGHPEADMGCPSPKATLRVERAHPVAGLSLHHRSELTTFARASSHSGASGEWVACRTAVAAVASRVAAQWAGDLRLSKRSGRLRPVRRAGSSQRRRARPL